MTVKILAASDPKNITHCAKLLKAGKLVAFGTETVYGLGAIASSDRAVEKVFSVKNRPKFNPLISHFSSTEDAFLQVEATDLAYRLAEAFWPGPLTLILPKSRSATVCDLASAGLATLAVRVPGTPAARALLADVGAPVCAPSANRFGGVSPSTAEHVFAAFASKVDAILDTGPCSVGLESTVLDLAGGIPYLLRPGGTTLEQLQSVCTVIVKEDAIVGSAPISPGLLASHYAPKLPVRLNAATVAEDEALIAFGSALNTANPTWNLSEKEDLSEAASRLYSGLHFLDQEGARFGLKGIAVMPIPNVGLGCAINNRLRRASSPRPVRVNEQFDYRLTIG